MDQVKRFLREVALNVSRLTEEIADKLDDKEKQEEASQKEEFSKQTEVASETTPETKESQEKDKTVSSEVNVEEEPSTEGKANEAESETRKALSDSIKRRDEENKIFSPDQSAFIIDGENYVEKAEEKKHDIEYMKKCCALELTKMKEKNEVPAPFYFERVAILSKKEKNYEQEVKYCEDYIKALDEFYANNKESNATDVRKTAKYHSLVKRMEKAKDLISKQ